MGPSDVSIPSSFATRSAAADGPEWLIVPTGLMSSGTIRIDRAIGRKPVPGRATSAPFVLPRLVRVGRFALLDLPGWFRFDRLASMDAVCQVRVDSFCSTCTAWPGCFAD